MKQLSENTRALIYLFGSLLLAVLCLAGAEWIDNLMMLVYNLK